MSVIKIDYEIIGSCVECGAAVNHFAPTLETGERICTECRDENIHNEYKTDYWDMPWKEIKLRKII